ncbi:hypothetical protein J6590_049238 [Homalodisca vitripennis]|nr:hypothetical protein J6590_049238 [Homalodisca vitripennis]
MLAVSYTGRVVTDSVEYADRAVAHDAVLPNTLSTACCGFSRAPRSASKHAAHCVLRSMLLVQSRTTQCFQTRCALRAAQYVVSSVAHDAVLPNYYAVALRSMQLVAAIKTVSFVFKRNREARNTQPKKAQSSK